MAQRKETKKKVKVRDLNPKKDAKGGLKRGDGNANKQTDRQQHQQTRFFGP